MSTFFSKIGGIIGSADAGVVTYFDEQENKYNINLNDIFNRGIIIDSITDQIDSISSELEILEEKQEKINVSTNEYQGLREKIDNLEREKKELYGVIRTLNSTLQNFNESNNNKATKQEHNIDNKEVNWLKKTLKELIGKAKLDELFEEAYSKINDIAKPYNELLLVHSQYSRLRTEKNSMILQRHEFVTEMNMITFSLLSIVDEIESSDLKNKGY